MHLSNTVRNLAPSPQILLYFQMVTNRRNCAAYTGNHTHYALLLFIIAIYGLYSNHKINPLKISLHTEAHTLLTIMPTYNGIAMWSLSSYACYIISHDLFTITWLNGHLKWNSACPRPTCHAHLPWHCNGHAHNWNPPMCSTLINIHRRKTNYLIKIITTIIIIKK